LALAYPAAAWRTRHEIATIPRRLIWRLLVPSVLGGLVEALILVGTVLFVPEPRLSRRSGSSSSSRLLSSRLVPLALVVTLVVAVYGGYFGAGIGILMISAISLFGLGEVDRVVPLKNLLTGCLRGVAVAVLIIEGVVNWSYGVPMIPGGLIGGYVGGMVANRAPRRFLRALVTVIGLGIAACYFWTVYGASIPRIGVNSGSGTRYADCPRKNRLA
jgi:uncharacterized membrane protein YfcA